MSVQPPPVTAISNIRESVMPFAERLEPNFDHQFDHQF